MHTPPPAFQLETLWRLDATPTAVWRALTRVEDWPQWWPYVAEVQTLRAGQGVGAVRHLRWRTRLPYSLSLVMTCTAAERERRLAGRAVGHLQGEGEWTLWTEGAQTCVRYCWAVDVQKPWMRRSLRWLAPLFRWNHHAVMRAGEQGLRRWLAQQPASGLDGQAAQADAADQGSDAARLAAAQVHLEQGVASALPVHRQIGQIAHIGDVELRPHEGLEPQ